jgi:hypothetical protein
MRVETKYIFEANELDAAAAMAKLAASFGCVVPVVTYSGPVPTLEGAVVEVVRHEPKSPLVEKAVVSVFQEPVIETKTPSPQPAPQEPVVMVPPVVVEVIPMVMPEPDVGQVPEPVRVQDKFVPCLVPGCARQEYSRGLCSSHYQKFRTIVREKNEEGLDGEAQALAVLGVSSLTPGKKGRKPAAQHIEVEPEKYPGFIHVKSVNVNFDPTDLIKHLTELFGSSTNQQWDWSYSGETGRIIVTDSKVLFLSNSLSWEASLIEKGHIMHVLKTYGLRKVTIGGEGVLSSVFESKHCILPTIENPPRFQVRALTDFSHDGLEWKSGDTFKVFDFNLIGAAFDALTFWTMSPPEEGALVGLTTTELKNKYVNCLRRLNASDLHQYFELEYVGILPVGAFKEIQQVNFTTVL